MYKLLRRDKYYYKDTFQTGLKFSTFLPFIVITATAFPGLSLNASVGQPQILSGISMGTNRTGKKKI